MYWNEISISFSNSVIFRIYTYSQFKYRLKCVKFTLYFKFCLKIFSVLGENKIREQHGIFWEIFDHFYIFFFVYPEGNFTRLKFNQKMTRISRIGTWLHKLHLIDELLYLLFAHQSLNLRMHFVMMSIDFYTRLIFHSVIRRKCYH